MGLTLTFYKTKVVSQPCTCCKHPTAFAPFPHCQQQQAYDQTMENVDNFSYWHNQIIHTSTTQTQAQSL